MPSHFFKWVLLPVFVLFSFNIYSQTIKLTPEAKISIITCGTGNELHSLFGHTGIRVLDESLGIDLVYNYGAFDFSAPNFYGRFIKGDLLYFIGLDDFNSFLFNYRMSNRSVWEQNLNIPLTSKQAIFNELASTYGTTKALYTYKFIDKNCTTLAVDLIKKHMEGLEFNLSIPKSEGESDREILNQYLQRSYIVGLGINLIFGAKTDQDFDHIFLPDQFLKSIELTSYKGSPINSSIVTHFKANEPINSYWPQLIGSCIVGLVLGLLCMYRSVSLLFYTFIGLLSLFLFSMQFYSFHSEVFYNYNLLLINPLFLIALFYLITHQFKKYKTILKCILYCVIAYTFIVILNGYLFMVFPILLCIALTLFIQLKVTK